MPKTRTSKHTRHTPFSPDAGFRLGLGDPSPDNLTSHCLFCLAFGFEDRGDTGIGKKRRRSQPNSRLTIIRNHSASQVRVHHKARHPTKWEQYQALVRSIQEDPNRRRSEALAFFPQPAVASKNIPDKPIAGQPSVPSALSPSLSGHAIPGIVAAPVGAGQPGTSINVGTSASAREQPPVQATSQVAEVTPVTVIGADGTAPPTAVSVRNTNAIRFAVDALPAARRPPVPSEPSVAATVQGSSAAPRESAARTSEDVRFGAGTPAVQPLAVESSKAGLHPAAVTMPTHPAAPRQGLAGSISTPVSFATHAPSAALATSSAHIAASAHTAPTCPNPGCGGGEVEASMTPVSSLAGSAPDLSGVWNQSSRAQSLRARVLASYRNISDPCGMRVDSAVTELQALLRAAGCEKQVTDDVIDDAFEKTCGVAPVFVPLESFTSAFHSLECEFGLPSSNFCEAPAEILVRFQAAAGSAGRLRYRTAGNVLYNLFRDVKKAAAAQGGAMPQDSPLVALRTRWVSLEPEDARRLARSCSSSSDEKLGLGEFLTAGKLLFSLACNSQLGAVEK